MGKVYLVGAGPGDLELLTVKAKRLLEQAEVVVYDRLVSDDIMALVPESAERHYVGKASANHAMPQEELNEWLADLALAGKNVVRLKGGDPYVFGRGGEEGEVLYKRGVAFEVVPGITSAIGGLSYAGIPVTHRDWTSSFHVFTGHFKEESREHNWAAMTQFGGTLVFLMGVANLKFITEKLLENGMAKDMPAAIVSNGTRSEQSVVEGTLSTILDIAMQAKVEPPSLFVVGQVVKCREQLNWFEKRPLFGKKIVVTRAQQQAGKLSEQLKNLGASVYELPAIEIQPVVPAHLDQVLDSLHQQHWAIFTSENGVMTFMDALIASGKDARQFGTAKIAAIGTGTAKKLKDYGLVADLIPERFVAEGLIESLENKLSPEHKVLLIQGTGARPLLREWLNEHSALTLLETYQTVEAGPLSKDALAKIQSADWITFTSGSTVNSFFARLEQSQGTLSQGQKLASIGPITSEALENMGKTVCVEGNPHNIEGLIESIQNWESEEFKQ